MDKQKQRGSAAPVEHIVSRLVCSQCGRDCGRRRLCRLRLHKKYVDFLIDKELEKLDRMTR